MGVGVPEQISVIGFDNLEMSQYSGVPLTMVSQDFQTIGYKAAEIVTNSIRTGFVSSENIIVPTKLIERNSVFDRSKTV